jgi:hypothetical protein
MYGLALTTMRYLYSCLQSRRSDRSEGPSAAGSGKAEHALSRVFAFDIGTTLATIWEAILTQQSRAFLLPNGQPHVTKVLRSCSKQARTTSIHP